MQDNLKCSPRQHYEMRNCDKVNNSNSAKDKTQFLGQMDEVFDHINIKSPKTIIGYGHKLVKVLKETQNEQHLLFLKEFNFKLRHEHFTPEKWYRNSLNDTCSKLAQDTELASLWTELLDQINLTLIKGQLDHQGSKEMFQKNCKKSCKRRCITFLATDQLNLKKDEKKSSIRQILKAFEIKTSHIKKDATFNSVQHNDKCFRCEDESHWARQCPSKASHDSAWPVRQKYYCRADRSFKSKLSNYQYQHRKENHMHKKSKTIIQATTLSPFKYLDYQKF